MKSKKKKIREICKDLLEKGTVQTVIGYTEGGVEGMRIPYIFNKPEDAQKLEWDQRCAPNLSAYLRGRKEKIGIVAKPCDIRGIINYLIENQLVRDNIYIIGVDCVGMTNTLGELLPGCDECTVKRPPLFDERVENPDVTDEDTKNVSEKDADELAENLEKFQNEMKKCILCYSCRQACYGCYCDVCFMDRGVPNWQPATPDIGAKMVYHLGRAMHLSGRCVECGACERVCASGVNVRYIIKEVTRFIEEIYGHKAGLDTETQPVMTTYLPNDREIGFLGGEAHE